MSVVDDSPVNSSSSEDFAAFLDTELDSASDANETYHVDINRTKRQKVDVFKSVESSMKEDICTHPGIIGGMCMKCGEKMDDQTGVAFGYIHKDLRLANDEITRLRDRDLKNLFSHEKLCLVLDLDHTLLNSTRIIDVSQEEGYLMNQSDHTQGALRDSLFKLDSMHMLTKLRPFVHTFLKEASKLFEMYIYTMGERAYALEMANVLDPKKVYFDSRVIAQSDCTQRLQKGLDVVLGQESVVLILDDTEAVWVKHKENLILMERYHFFASSCKQFGYKCKSLSELKSDESEVDGALARVLQVLKRIHNMFFDPELGDNFTGRDVRQVLGTVRGEILKGCKIVFSRVFPTKFQAENHQLWKMAERLGAACVTDVDLSVTHVISTDVGTEKSRWAVQHNKFLVEPRWLEAANYLWKRQPEDMFPVKEMKIKSVRIRKMNNEDDDNKDAKTGTPLASIAQAFEEIGDLIKKGNKSEGSVDLRLKPFCEACSLVSVLFGCLGIAFRFAEMEYTSKVRDLLEASRQFATLSSVVDFDMRNKTVKSPGSHTRNLRRVRQGLDLIRELFQNFLSDENHSLKKAATQAYQQVCAPYHTWAVRAAVSAGMCTLPTREQLLLNLNETDKSAEKEMRRYIKASHEVIKNIDNLYISRNIELDW